MIPNVAAQDLGRQPLLVGRLVRSRNRTLVDKVEKFLESLLTFCAEDGGPAVGIPQRRQASGRLGEKFLMICQKPAIARGLSVSAIFGQQVDQ